MISISSMQLSDWLHTAAVKGYDNADPEMAASHVRAKQTNLLLISTWRFATGLGVLQRVEEGNAERPPVAAAAQKKAFKPHVAMPSAVGRLSDMSERRIDRVEMSDCAGLRASPKTSSESTSGSAVSWTQCAEQHCCYLFFDNDFVFFKRAPHLT